MASSTAATSSMAISAITGAIDTATVTAVGNIIGVGMAMPVIICTFVGCGAVAFMAMSLVQAGSRS